MKKILINLKYITRLSLKWTSYILAFLGWIALFAPLNEIFDSSIHLIKKIAFSCIGLLVIWIVFFIFAAIHICNKKKYELFSVGNNHHVYVMYGDIFNLPSDIGQSKNIVIPVNRCFDTIVDDDLVSSRTLHGMAMQKLYDNNIFTQEKLNDKIQKCLKNKQIGHELIEQKKKRKGNLKRYPVGTVVEINANEHTKYFFLALTYFDSELHAHVSDDEYILSLIKAIMYNNSRSQGKPLILPLIGGGASGTQKDERSILEYIVKLLKMNRLLINSDVFIVVHEKRRDNLAITDL